MKIGYIGLGKMGKNMVLRLLEGGAEVVAWNRSPEPRAEVAKAGASTTETPVELVQSLESPRIIWLMLPSGAPTDEILHQIKPHLSKGDLVVDGANAYYKDSIRRGQELAEMGVRFMDIGVSGGPRGAREGACLMIGGEKGDVETLKPVIEAAAAPEGWQHLGPVGAGHFAKMVHNGIEYGMMQAIAEGAAILKQSPYHYDLAQVFNLYNHQSVITSRLVGWAESAFKDDPELSHISSAISHTGEGAWTVDTAKELGVDVPVITESLEVRKRSSVEPENFRNKVVSALRGQFGGHAVAKHESHNA